ncbi:MAG TPA: TIGR03013 family XrtA/PEP-CTERM system glycosyltransferase [Gammaproteobacteria bacterium]|nr:TIGR03013 family XrtA/PEP-CTERM system glycosyltransferase [Gammaproteobacteria bacterium]
MATIRIFKHYIPTQFLLLGLLEVVLLIIAFHIGVELRFLDATPAVREHVQPLFPKSITFALVVVVTMIGLGLYQRSLREGMEAMTLRLGASFLVSIVPLTLLYYLLPGLYLGRGALFMALLVALPLLLALRFYFFRIVDQDLLKRRVLVLGAGEKASMISRLRRQTDRRGFRVVGYVHMTGDQDLPDEDRVEQEKVISLGMPLPDYVRKMQVDEIVLAVDDRRNAMPVDEILDCKMDGVEVCDLLSFFEREAGKVLLDILQPSWMFLSDGFDQGILRSFSKRAFDVVFALALLPLLLPLMALVMLAVYLEDPRAGSILFSQVRVGRNNHPFTIYKFRSMTVTAEEDGVARWASKNDARITRVGSIIRKVRLDELPQIFNVLRGDMSFVGPRPERPEFVSQLEETIPYYRERHRVKPGLTGWAQIRYQYGSSERDAFEKLQYDLYYVKNHGVFLDLLILLTTAEVVLWGKGAH